MDKNIQWNTTKVTREMRGRGNSVRPVVLWFTGLPGSGKTTIAQEVEEALQQQGNKTYLLDGDNVRHGLSSDLSFSPDDIRENNRRIGEVAKLFLDAGVIPLVSFVSPFRSNRTWVRNLVGQGEFIEIYVKTSLEECRRRDPKGLYRKAEEKKIENFIGVHIPYEEPENAELTLDTEKNSMKDCVRSVLNYLQTNCLIL